VIVNWTDFAKARLHKIHDVISEDSPMAADKTVKRIVKRSEQISQFPQSGREVPEYREQEIREILERPYRIIYRILPTQIDVLTVMHYRQLLPESLDVH